MTDELEQDPMIERVRATLRGSPAVTPDPRAVARVLSAAFGAPRRPAWRRVLDGWRMPALSGLGASALAAAALLLGFVTRGAVSTRVEPDPMASEGTPTGEYPVQLASHDATAPIPTQFVFEAPAAREISIVGEFNDWKVGATPLQQLPNGLWTATVPLTPGRHVYAYVLDGTLLVADPRAPKAGDADYGREGSVVMVFAR